MVWRRGEIVGVNLNPRKGHEVGKVRPCVILSDDDANEMLDTVVVVPLSTSLRENVYPYRVRLLAREGLIHDSDVLINHVRAVLKRRITSRIARVEDGEYRKIIQALCESVQ